jgi:hypothetical protein
MNTLSLSNKKKLLSLAKRLKATMNRYKNFERKANNIVGNSQITVHELAYPTTNASRNVVRQIQRIERMMNYLHGHMRNISLKIVSNYPSAANISHSKIIRNVSENIRRHENALKSIHSGKYQTHGRFF